jgi:hypothetical protein
MNDYCPFYSVAGEIYLEKKKKTLLEENRTKSPWKQL